MCWHRGLNLAEISTSPYLPRKSAFDFLLLPAANFSKQVKPSFTTKSIPTTRRRENFLRARFRLLATQNSRRASKRHTHTKQHFSASSCSCHEQEQDHSFSPNLQKWACLCGSARSRGPRSFAKCSSTLPLKLLPLFSI